MFGRSRKLIESVRRTFSRKNNNNNDWRKRLDIWKQKLNRNFNQNLNQRGKSMELIGGIIGVNVSLYVLYKLGLPSREFYTNLVSINQYTANPFSYVLATFYHEDLIHLVFNCLATYQIMMISQNFLPKRALLVTYLVAGTMGNYSAKQALMEK